MFANIVRALTGSNSTLPAEIFQVLDSVRVMDRTQDEEDLRIFVAFAGSGWRGAFLFERTVAATRLVKKFPELTSRQIERGVDLIEAKIVKHRSLNRLPQKRRRNWVLDF